MGWIGTTSSLQAVQHILRERYKEADHARMVQALREARYFVPPETALSVCKQIQQENRYPLARWRCQRCMRFGQDGIPSRLMPSCRCAKVSQRYHKALMQST